MLNTLSSRWALAIVTVAIVAGACSRQLMSVLLDLPEPKVAPVPATVQQTAADSVAASDTIRPAIEREFDAVVVQSLLPRDVGGNIDWSRALRDSIIKPRFLPNASPKIALDSGFNYDVFLADDSTATAVFSHTAHLEWLSCQSCHVRLFPKKHETITHKAMQERRYCGACHGTVAFPMRTACERCHQGMQQPPGEEANGDLLGDITFVRRSDGKPVPDSVPQLAFAPSRFSHWTHRIRYRCSACHARLYEERAGSSQTTMDEISNGKSCGACHNGKIAFAPDIQTCDRCHSSAGR